MKKLVFTILGIVVGVAIGHCMMAFYWLSFDPSTWTAEARYVALNLYLLLGVPLGIAARSGVK